MFKDRKHNKAELDRVGRKIVFVASNNDEAAEAAASSPFLFTRVRTAIAQAEPRDDAAGWLPLLFVARRAVPAMAVIAFLAATLTVWSLRPSTPSSGYGIYEDALADTRDPGVEQQILTRNNLSRDEVLSLIVERGGREKR